MMILFKHLRQCFSIRAFKKRKKHKIDFVEAEYREYYKKRFGKEPTALQISLQDIAVKAYNNGYEEGWKDCQRKKKG